MKLQYEKTQHNNITLSSLPFLCLCMETKAITTPALKNPITKQDILKKQNTIITFLFVCVVGACIFLCVKLVINYSSMNAKNAQLRLLTYYDTSSVATNKTTEARMINRRTLDDIVATNKEIKEEQKRYDDYYEVLHSPYDNFMQYVYLPPLNIRRNPYTNLIDTELIWRKFLERNQYTDLYLITRWSNFFKDVWDRAQFNEITNITINPIQEQVNWLYTIPISLSFTSPSKRSFLLLVEKLSSTSNKENIALINEFTHYLREEIKNQKNEDIAAITGPWAMETEEDIDKKLGYYMYNRLWETKNVQEETDISKEEVILPWMPANPLITEDIIDEAIKKSAWCKVAKTEKCYYLFREKFRSIPYLAYSISDAWVNKVEAFRIFLQNIPPIIKITEFNFDKARSAKLISESTEFNWKIWLTIHGKWIPPEEVEQISVELWKTCYKDQHALTVEDALSQIDADIKSIWEIDTANASKSKELQDLRQIIETIHLSYEWLSYYAKAVKLFETYRMLSDASVCDI